MIPEGKAMNQEVEAEVRRQYSRRKNFTNRSIQDDAVNEEARITAEAAEAQRQLAAREAVQQQALQAAPIDLDSGDDNVDVAPSRTTNARRDVPRRSDGTRERRTSGRAGGSGAAASAAVGRTSSTTGGRAPTSRESGVSGARAPPRASGRYSSGGGSAAAALPRYSTITATGVSNTSRNSGGRDLDAEIPEAEEASYGNSFIDEGSTPEIQRPVSDSEDDEPSVMVRSVARPSRREELENRQDPAVEDSTDMDLSS